MFIPIIIIIIGVLWLLNNLGVVNTDIWSIVLPSAVILIGLSMLSKSHGCSWFKSKRKDQSPPDKP